MIVVGSNAMCGSVGVSRLTLIWLLSVSMLALCGPMVRMMMINLLVISDFSHTQPERVAHSTSLLIPDTIHSVVLCYCVLYSFAILTTVSLSFTAQDVCVFVQANDHDRVLWPPHPPLVPIAMSIISVSSPPTHLSVELDNICVCVTRMIFMSSSLWWR